MQISHGGEFASTTSHHSHRCTGLAGLQINNGNAIESRRSPMSHFDEVKPELQPPARLQTIQKRVGQQKHSAISGICHNDEIAGEEELRRVGQAVDDQINGGIILKIFANSKRSERALPSRIQPELEAAPAWALLTRQNDAVDVGICTGRLGTA
jgi:hypothetical protein